MCVLPPYLIDVLNYLRKNPVAQQHNLSTFLQIIMARKEPTGRTFACPTRDSFQSHGGFESLDGSSDWSILENDVHQSSGLPQPQSLPPYNLIREPDEAPRPHSLTMPDLESLSIREYHDEGHPQPERGHRQTTEAVYSGSVHGQDDYTSPSPGQAELPDFGQICDSETYSNGYTEDDRIPLSVSGEDVDTVDSAQFSGPVLLSRNPQSDNVSGIVIVSRATALSPVFADSGPVPQAVYSHSELFSGQGLPYVVRGEKKLDISVTCNKTSSVDTVSDGNSSTSKEKTSGISSGEFETGLIKHGISGQGSDHSDSDTGDPKASPGTPVAKQLESDRDEDAGDQHDQETCIKSVTSGDHGDENGSPEASLALTEHEDLKPDALNLSVREPTKSLGADSDISLKGSNKSGSVSETDEQSLEAQSQYHSYWEKTYSGMPETLHGFWIPRRDFNQLKELCFYRNRFPLSLKKLLEADTRNKALKTLFAKLHEANQKLLVQVHQINELQASLQVTKQQSDHLATLLEQKFLTLSDVLFIFLVKDKGSSLHKETELPVLGKTHDIRDPKPESDSGRKSAFLSKLTADWGASVKIGSSEESVTLGDLLLELGVSMNDPKAVGGLMLNLVQEIVKLKQAVANQASGGVGKTVDVYLEAAEYEEVIKSLREENGQLEYALETLRKVIFSQKYGQTDSLIQVIYDLQEKVSKLEKNLATEQQMNHGYQGSIEKLNKEKEALESKIQQMSTDMERIIQQKKELYRVEEKETSSLDENKMLEEIQTLEQKVASMYHEHSQARACWDRGQAALLEQVRQHELHNQHLHKAYQELEERFQEEVDAKKAYLESQPAILKQLRMDKGELEQKIDFLKRDVGRLEDQIGIQEAQLEWAHKELQTKKTALEKEKKLQEQMLTRYKQENAVLQRQSQQWDQQVKALTALLQKKEQEKKSLEQLVTRMRQLPQQPQMMSPQYMMPQAQGFMMQPQSLGYQPRWYQPSQTEIVVADGPAARPAHKPTTRYICSKCFKSDFVDQSDYERHCTLCKGQGKT